MPNLLDNLYRHQVLTSNGTLYLYGAYLDVRPRIPKVRLLGMMNRLRPRVKMFCHLWFENSNRPAISRVESFTHIWTQQGRLMGNGPLQPYLLTCSVPASYVNSTPILVSLVEKVVKTLLNPVFTPLFEKVCDTSTALLKVTYNRLEEDEDRKKIAICVKGLDFQDDLSLRLI